MHIHPTLSVMLRGRVIEPGFITIHKAIILASVKTNDNGNDYNDKKVTSYFVPPHRREKYSILEYKLPYTTHEL